ncbi:hypothetical protein D3Y57_00495 (plasmid) [Sphingomonas paeninsulae]|uniref:Uncharacterized protein n=1 Tax=Sphingomonas paeninsulae TaxID=2319844 RepID=A0A494T5G0_SPHPE|nr:hypothetical protein [Sphingomonas paeninsulae]AYJ84619.1 hypothetical protein D3Y57_00495 [Sphingomonas paeninsulae]
MIQLLIILLQVIGDLVGGAAIAAAVSWALWNLFKVTHHPELGPVAGFLIVATILLATHQGTRMLPIITIFSLISIFCGWSEGSVWRSRIDAQKTKYKVIKVAGMHRSP